MVLLGCSSFCTFILDEKDGGCNPAFGSRHREAVEMWYSEGIQTKIASLG